MQENLWYCTLIFISRIKESLSKNAGTIAIQSLVLSRINYGIKTWGSTSATQRQRVQKMQNFAAKVTLGGGKKHDHVTPFLRELGWLKIEYRYKYELASFVYSSVKAMLPHYLFPMPTIRDICCLPTRQQHNLHEPNTNTSTGAQSLLVAGPKLWNSLPECVKTASTLPTFKKQLYQHLLIEQFMK